MVKNFIFLKITILSFINHIFSKIVLPLKELPRENYLLLYPQNSIYDIIDAENRNSFYTTFQIGYPKQNVPLVIKSKSNYYLIATVCSNINNSSVYINEKYNFSKNFLLNYDYYCETKSNSSRKNWCRENEYLDKELCSFNDDILFYEAQNMSNKIVNINFEIIDFIKDNITGEIGLNLYDREGRSYNSFFGILKTNQLIENYNWYFDFNSPNEKEGKLIIGSLPHEDYSSLYNEDDLILTNSFMDISEEFLKLKFTKIYTIDNENDQNIEYDLGQNAEFCYDFNLIYGTGKYKNYLYNKLEKLLGKDCFIDKIKNFGNPGNFTFFYCKRNKYIKNKLQEIIKPIYLTSFDLNYTFEITINDILKEKGDYIFIQIIFPELNSKWSLGKLFSLKYKFIFNQKEKLIGFYTKKHNQNENGDKEPDSSNFKVILMLCIIAVLSIFLVIFGYFLGKYINKTRKRRANELTDDFDYSQDIKNENNNNINSVFIDEDKNIN